MKLTSALTLTALLCSTMAATAGVGFTIKKTPAGGLIVMHDGLPFAEYVVDQSNKPYLAPVFGPGGKQMTRNFPMKTVPGEQQDHPQHRGISFASDDIAGVGTWSDKLALTKEPVKDLAVKLARIGTVRHRAYREVAADLGHATIVDLCDVTDAKGRKLYEEEHRMVFLADADKRTIDFDVRLVASEGPITVHDVKEAGFSIRVPSSIAVESKLGGTIVNSNGDRNDDAWGKRASWCDYSGPVDGQTVGVAMLNHPSSFRFPTPWHVRAYGLFAANPFGTKSLDRKAPDGTFELAKGQDVNLRHRLIFHRGDANAARIAVAFEVYAREDMPGSAPSLAGGAASPLAGSPSAAIQTDPHQPLLETISQQAPNAIQWALAPLDQSVPGDIQQNLMFLREDLLDEGKQNPKAGADAYALAAQICNALLIVFEERNQTLVRAGFRAVEANARTGVTSQALDARRNYKMSWPQFAREESQRAELKSQAVSGAAVLAERPKVEWSTRTAALRIQLDQLYAKYRDALRQSAK